MRKWVFHNIITTVLLAGLLLSFVPTVYASEQEALPESLPEPAPAEDTRVFTQHADYMAGSNNGLFYPDRTLKRSEFAVICKALAIGEIPEDAQAPEYADDTADLWFAEYADYATEAGLLLLDEEGAFRGEDPVTRAECAYALAQTLWSQDEGKTKKSKTSKSEEPVAPFPDVLSDHWAAKEIARCASEGIFGGDDQGYFRPENGLTRAEAVTVFNNLLGRKADVSAIGASAELAIFPDVPSGHWAYYQIMEATTCHTAADNSFGAEDWGEVQPREGILQDGFLRINGRLYCVKDGRFLYNTQDGIFVYDANGRYTTGNAELDEKLNAVINRLVSPSMTREQQMRALFNYCRDDFTYLKRDLVDLGTEGWEPAYALEFLNIGKGNCYSFSSTYTLLCRNLGLEAYCTMGSLQQWTGPHGWTIVVLDGRERWFDTQMAWRYLHNWNMQGYDLFDMDPENPRIGYNLDFISRWPAQH